MQVPKKAYGHVISSWSTGGYHFSESLTLNKETVRKGWSHVFVDSWCNRESLEPTVYLPTSMNGWFLRGQIRSERSRSSHGIGHWDRKVRKVEVGLPGWFVISWIYRPTQDSSGIFEGLGKCLFRDSDPPVVILAWTGTGVDLSYKQGNTSWHQTKPWLKGKSWTWCTADIRIPHLQPCEPRKKNGRCFHEIRVV